MPGKILLTEKVDFKLDERGVGAFIFDAVNKFGDEICQIDGDRNEKETFASVKKRSVRCAIEMRKRGVNEEDIILFCSKNTLNSAIPVVAALYLGAKVASIDPILSVRDCKHAITLVNPTFVFVEEDSVQLIEESVKEANSNTTIVVVGESKKHIKFSQFQNPTPEENDFKPVTVKDPNDTTVILFSSGTTGLPKGICITHNGFQHGMLDLLSMTDFTPKVLCNLSTLYWVSGLMILLMSFQIGAARVLTRYINGEKLLQLVEKYKIEYTFFAPIFAYQLTVLPNAESYDTSSLHYVILGGSPISAEQMERTRQLLKHTQLSLGYGQTEASAFISTFDFNRDQAIYKSKPTSSGKAGKNMQIKIVDTDSGAILEPFQKGEICYNSPLMMKGYHNQDSSHVYDKDGFIKSGDIGYYDEDDCIYVVDRIKEMFKYRSWHVVPSSLELLLQEHPDIKEAVVFGVPHEIDEFHPAACVVLKDGAKTTAEEIDKFMSGKVADIHKLRGGIRIVESIFKTPSGKVQRSKMRDFFVANKN